MNMKYINVMVGKEKYQDHVTNLLNGLENATARMVDERDHGYIIRIGSPSNDDLDEIRKRSTFL